MTKFVQLKIVRVEYQQEKFKTSAIRKEEISNEERYLFMFSTNCFLPENDLPLKMMLKIDSQTHSYLFIMYIVIKVEDS